MYLKTILLININTKFKCNILNVEQEKSYLTDMTQFHEEELYNNLTFPIFSQNFETLHNTP